MCKKFIIIMVLIFTGLFGLSPAAGAVGPYVKIDGKLRQFDPAPQIVNDRTMIPIRFVIEDEALKGQVYWDGNLRKVAIDCRGKYIEMFIGSKEAMVDGETKYFDTAPYIFANRTYIPLRFLAENLGAAVGWDNQKKEVIINFNQQIKVFAYYYRSLAEYQMKIGLFSDVAFRWLETNGKGELFYEYNDRYSEILQLAGEKSIKTHASVVLMDKDQLHQLLSSQVNRARLIGNLLDEVKKNNYDGVNIDFEFIDPADGSSFTAFLRELKTSLGPEKELSVAVFARTGKERWKVAYQYDKIGEIADWVVVMAYDYSYPKSAPGPVAPLWWVQEVVAYMVDNIPREKILLGLPTYGYDWAEAKNGTSVTAARLQALQKQYEVKEYFDNQSMSPYFKYTDNKGQNHQIWLENEKSLAAKLNLAIDNQLGGISFWRIGNGFEDLYRLLEKKLL